MQFRTQFYKILQVDIFELYASMAVCKLKTDLQFVYSTVLKGYEDPRDSEMDLMGFIEKEYECLRFDLDNLDVKIVKKVTAEIMSEDIITMQRAERSRRAIKECDIMRKSLRASFEPPRYKNYNKRE